MCNGLQSMTRNRMTVFSDCFTLWRTLPSRFTGIRLVSAKTFVVKRLVCCTTVATRIKLVLTAGLVGHRVSEPEVAIHTLYYITFCTDHAAPNPISVTGLVDHHQYSRRRLQTRSSEGLPQVCRLHPARDDGTCPWSTPSFLPPPSATTTATR